jgi:hypothetical protein
VNDDAKALAMAFPAVSRTSATLTAYPVPPAKGLLGVNVALAPVTAIVPAADPTENVEVVTDAGMTGSENVTVTLAPAATPVAPWAGTIERTLGGVVSPAPGPLDSPEQAVRTTAAATSPARGRESENRGMGCTLLYD